MTGASFSSPTYRDPQNAFDQDPIEQRRFTTEQHEAILKTLHTAFRTDANGDLPAIFHRPVAMVLTLTTFDDLIARYRIPENRKHPRYQALDHALKLYCASSQYSHAMITEDSRYNLDMEPGDPLTDADRKSGENRLRACNAQRGRRRRGSASMRSLSPPERP